MEEIPIGRIRGPLNRPVGSSVRPSDLLLTPRVAARETLRFMNTQQLTALRTGPSFLFVLYELSYTELLDAHKIVNHAHAILRPIAFVQVVQFVAREPVAADAVSGLAEPDAFTSLDSAYNPGFWLGAVVAPAAGTCVLLPRICDTESTVHSTGGDQRGPNRICFC